MVQSSPPNTTYNNTNKRSQLKPPNEIFKIDVGIMPMKSNGFIMWK